MERKPESSGDERKNVFESIKQMLPEDAGFVKADFEGPDIAVYLKNPAAAYENENIIKNIAAAIKRKIILRGDSSALMDPKEALEEINRLVPVEAKVNNVKFVPEFGEVYIESLKPGLVIGKGGSTLKSIAIKTGWLPRCSGPRR